MLPADFVYRKNATPLAQLKAGESVNTFDMLIGNTAGTIGETSVIAIMIGAIFLLLMGVIDLRIPGTYIVTFALFIGIFGGFVDGIGFFNVQYMTAELCGGGLMLGAWFMATDYVTSPITKKGQIVYGILLGCLTGLFRLFGGSAEGVSYAIIFSNLLVPLIERVPLPKPFGKGGEKYQKYTDPCSNHRCIRSGTWSCLRSNKRSNRTDTGKAETGSLSGRLSGSRFL